MDAHCGSRPLSAGEWVTASIPRGVIRGTDGAEMRHGFTWTFWVTVTATSMTFDEVGTLDVRRPGEYHIQTYGAYAGDLDGDGHVDFAGVNATAGTLTAYLGEGEGGLFLDQTHVLGDFPLTIDLGDLDGDGDLDAVSSR